MKARLILAAVVVLAAVGSVGADPGKGPHNEGGDVRFIGMGRMGVPWWMRQPGEPLAWYIARMRWGTREVPRIQNHETPAGDPDDPAPGGEPGEPCVNGDC